MQCSNAQDVTGRASRPTHCVRVSVVLVTGQDVDPAVVLTSIQKADMAFRMMMQMRNKLVQAYQEIKEMRI